MFGATLLALACAACSTPTERPQAEPQDCIIDAGGVVGGAAGGLEAAFAGQADGRSGYIAVRNTSACENVRAFARTPSGTLVCVAPEREWCTETAASVPVTMTTKQLQQLLGVVER